VLPSIRVECPHHSSIVGRDGADGLRRLLALHAGRVVGQDELWPPPRLERLPAVRHDPTIVVNGLWSEFKHSRCLAHGEVLEEPDGFLDFAIAQTIRPIKAVIERCLLESRVKPRILPLRPKGINAISEDPHDFQRLSIELALAR